MEVWRRAAGVQTWEAWRHGVLEARRKRRDLEVFASRDLELGRHAAGLGRWTV